MCAQFSTKQQHNSQLAAGLHPEKLHLVDYGLQKALMHMCLYCVFPGTKMDTLNITTKKIDQQKKIVVIK